MFAILAAATFVLGAIVGSFLNVVIHRYPLGESIVWPGSRCGTCRAPIKPYDNVPIVSWLILRGRCRACGAPFSSRYMLVELANALFYLAIFIRTGPTIGFLPLAAVISMTILLIYIDLDIQILPDVIDIPGIAIGLAVAALGIGAVHSDLTLAPDLLGSAIGAATGAAIIVGLNLAYRVARGADGMGMGDAKMLAMIGAVSGWKAVIIVLFLASIVGAVIGVALAHQANEKLDVAMPFGVFLGLAFLAALFFGSAMSGWYSAFLPA